MSAPSWESLGRPAPTALSDARLQLHHAAQLVSAVGKTLLDPQPDDSHPNLGWQASLRALAGHRVPGPHPFRAALRLPDLRLLLLDAAGEVADALSLAGETLASGQEWLEQTIPKRFGRQLPSGLTSPGYELPPHPVAERASFAGEPTEAFAELDRWFADCATALEDLAARTQGASEVRCWPHHFDLATLVALESGADGSATRTVGLGLSPGDGTYPEPYLYVSPWPYPDAAAELPALPGAAHWHREGFTAAILTGTALVSGGPAHRQRERLHTFLEAALAASRRIHGL